MKIVHLLPSISPGGAPINTLRTISRLSSAEHIVVAHCPRDIANPFVSKGIKFHSVNLSKPSLNSAYQLLRIIMLENPNIVHGNGKSGVFYSLFIKFFFYRITTVITYRGFHSQYRGLIRFLHIFIERLGYHLFEKLIFVSISERNHYCSFLNKDPRSNKIFVIPNGISIANNVEVKKPDSISRKCLNIAMIARIDPQKDILTPLSAIRLLKDKLSNINIKLDIYTVMPEKNNTYFNKILEMIEELNISKEVDFIFGKSQAYSFLKYYDFYLSTSIFEGLPTSLIEAGLSKIPVVSSDCRGNSDVMGKFKEWTFETGDPVALCNKIEKFIMLNKKEKISYSQKLYEEFHSLYNLEIHVKKIKSVYGI